MQSHRKLKGDIRFGNPLMVFDRHDERKGKLHVRFERQYKPCKPPCCGPDAGLGEADGRLAATAHGYLPHNAHSVYHRYAWGGLVAVAESHRGKGLGSYVNARMIDSVFHDLGATHVYELVSATNTPSRLMVEACGLRLEPAFACGFATSDQGARFTR